MADAPKKLNVAVLLIVASVFITVPVCTFALLYFWLTQSAFNSVEELKAEELEEIRIDIKNLPRGPQNRPDPLEGETLSPEENTTFHTDPDIPPTKLMRPDFDSFLGVLRGADPIEPMPASAYLGKIEIRYKDGRRGTIYLRWAVLDKSQKDAPAVVLMKINSSKYKAGTLKEFRTISEACSARGEKVKN